jgi:hypothetical protein
MGGTSVSTYGQTDLPAGSVLSLVLEGTPRAPESASASLVGGNTSELLIGAGAAVVVIALGALAVRRWQTGAADQEADQDELLQLLADLDDEFEAGDIDEQEYHRERAALKAELAAIWQSEEGE